MSLENFEKQNVKRSQSDIFILRVNMKERAFKGHEKIQNMEVCFRINNNQCEKLKPKGKILEC